MGHRPQKHRKHKKKKEFSACSGCDAAARWFDPSCPPLHPLQRSSKLLQTGNRSALSGDTGRHSKSILAHYVGNFYTQQWAPKTVNIGHLFEEQKKIQYKHFPFQLGLSSRREVRTCCADGLFVLRLCSHSRKDRYGELHLLLGIICSPTLRSSGQKCLQRGEKGRSLIKCSDFSTWLFWWLRLTLQKRRPFRSADRSARGGVRGGGEGFGFFAKPRVRVLIPEWGLACCKGPQPLVFCIETDRRACWCLVRGGLLGLVVEEEEVVA